MTTTPTQIIRTVCRRLSGDHGARPVHVVPGDCAPTLVGEGSHYRTRGGRRIYHPSAYSRSGWSNMVYFGSTARTEVGERWLAARAATVAALGIQPEGQIDAR